MAHFAELIQKTDPTGHTSDKLWVVERVVVVSNEHAPVDEGPEGENWCSTFFGGGTWKQTSYNHNFRKMYAGKGYTYDFDKNVFLHPQPYASWSLDDSNDWKAPVANPTNEGPDAENPYHVSWDEDNQRWIAKDKDDNNFIWDASGLAWVSA
tara:strand:+ start:3477 stop:3932 length:456 start_codon:yes stop_codon:yes gene_type:complete